MKTKLMTVAALIPLASAAVVVFVPSSTWQAAFQAPTASVTTSPSNPTQPTKNPPTQIPLNSNSQNSQSTKPVGSAPVQQSTPTLNPNAGSNLPIQVPSTQNLGFPAAAERLAALTGRRIIPVTETRQPPYNSVGRFFNEKAPSVTVGSGTVLRQGGSKVLTAAHVIEIGDAREKSLGKLMFALPGQQPSEVGDAELDGAWKSRTVSGDIGVCHVSITSSGLDLKETQLDGADEPVFGETVRIVGYDLDVWIACGCPDNPPLVERSTKFERMGKGREAKALRSFGEILKINRDMSSIWGDTPSAATGGVLAVLSGHAYLSKKMDDQFGWVSEAIGSLGCDGGPVLLDDSVMAVVGYPDGETVGPNKVTVGYLLGTRLTGPLLDMVENF